MSEIVRIQHLRRAFQRGQFDLLFFPGPGSGRKSVGLVVGRARQPSDHVHQVVVRIDSRTVAILDDGEEHRASLPGFLGPDE